MDNAENLLAAEVDQEARIEVERARSRGRFQTSSIASTSRTNSDARGARARKQAHSTHESVEETPLLGEQRDAEDEGRGAGHAQPWLGSEEFNRKPWWRRPSIWWLLPIFLPYALAFGGVLVPKVNLILTLICRDYFADQSSKNPNAVFAPIDSFGDNPQCRIPEIQKLVATFQLYANLLSGLLSALVSPKVGALSDRYGRTRVVAIAGLGTVVAETITLTVASLPDKFSVYWILLAYTVEGLSGSFNATMAVCGSYTADCTAPEDRAVAFGYWQGAFFAGVALGPLIAGYLTRATGSLIYVFWIALGCHLFFLVCLSLFVPESLSKERQMLAREKHKQKTLLQGGHAVFNRRHLNILEPLNILWPTGPGSNSGLRRNMVLLASIDTLMFGLVMGTFSILIIYLGYVFNWDTFETSIFVSTANVGRVTGLLIILPVLTRLVHGKPSTRPPPRPGASVFDVNIIRTAIFLETLGYIGFATARDGNTMLVAGMVAALGGMGSPTLQSALTKHVPPNQTGQLLGATGLLHALARVVFPVLFNLIYKATVATMPSAVFIVLASIFGVVFSLSWAVRPYVTYTNVDSGAVEPENEE